MPVKETNKGLKKSQKPQGLLVDLLGTTGVTMATAFASMATVALMARILERDEFLSYTLLIRYFSLAIVVLGIGTGFSFIGRDGQQKHDSATASLLLQMLLLSLCVGFVPWVLISLWLATSTELWPGWSVLGYAWVVAHTTFILSGPVARARGGVLGYVHLALGCRTAPYIAGTALVALTGEFMGLFAGFGMASVFWLWRFWAKGNIAIAQTVNWQAALSLFRFGATRWLDDVVRTLLPVALILATGFFLGADEAAVVALVYLVARVLESVLQPLVIALMMRGRSSAYSLRVDLLRVLVLSLVISALLYLLRPVLEELFVLFLGNTYQDVSALAWLMLMSAGAIICLNYLRARYDNRFSHSPVFFINLVFILILIVAVMWCNSVFDVIMCAVMAHAGRLLCYVGVLTMLLGRQKGVQRSKL